MGQTQARERTGFNLVKPEITARLILQQRNFIATHVAAVVAVTIVREMVDMSLASIVSVTH